MPTHSSSNGATFKAANEQTDYAAFEPADSPAVQAALCSANFSAHEPHGTADHATLWAAINTAHPAAIETTDGTTIRETLEPAYDAAEWPAHEAAIEAAEWPAECEANCSP